MRYPKLGHRCDGVPASIPTSAKMKLFPPTRLPKKYILIGPAETSPPRALCRKERYIERESEAKGMQKRVIKIKAKRQKLTFELPRFKCYEHTGSHPVFLLLCLRRIVWAVWMLPHLPSRPSLKLHVELQGDSCSRELDAE